MAKYTNKTIQGLLLLMIAPSLLATTLDSYTAEYKAYWKGIRVGAAKQKLTKTKKNTYIADALTNPISNIIPFRHYETSEFTLRDSKVLPIRYTYTNIEKGEKDEGELIFTNESGVYDKLSHIVQLKIDLKKGIKETSYRVKKPDKVSKHTFRVVRNEKLKTNIGHLDTVVVLSVSDSNDRETYIWMAPELDYLTVRMKQFRKGSLGAEIKINNLERS